MSATPILAVRDLQVSYGGIRAVQGASLALHAGELVSLIGANGAGKTTLLKAVTGLLAPAAGSVGLEGRPLDRVEAWQRVAQGLVMVPEGRGIFARMSIEENLRMGAYLRRDAEQVEADLADVYRRFARLKERRQQLAGTLSGGEQQMVAMGRALMARPRVLLLDEPSMGLSPLMVDAIFDVVRDIAAQGVTILLVEQNAHRALQMASRGYVMDSGRITLHGPAQALLDDPKVREAYLGL